MIIITICMIPVSQSIVVINLIVCVGFSGYVSNLFFNQTHFYFIIKRKWRGSNNLEVRINKPVLNKKSQFFDFVSQTALSGGINANKTNQLSQTIRPSKLHNTGFTVCLITDIWLLASLGRCTGWPVSWHYCGLLHCK